MSITTDERDRLTQRREQIKDEFLAPTGSRPATIARGIHHTALICSDVRRTVDFYQNIVGFPLIEMFENRDLAGSTHFFFDLGNGNALAFFDLPGVEPGPYAEVLGGLHHLAISVTPDDWKAARERLDAAGIQYQLESGTSIYLPDPDGTRLELIADKLGEMYGEKIG
ncbi:MAG TPA: VOC family protein [Pseudonocardia sp.]|jgi:catechol 2,3-dioxygenase-like lactoylglutathione lyase family enzyme|nr:VOC family protein [Pseudonocardia sp.]